MITKNIRSIYRQKYPDATEAEIEDICENLVGFLDLLVQAGLDQGYRQHAKEPPACQPTQSDQV